jgi:hypothetical protein
MVFNYLKRPFRLDMFGLVPEGVRAYPPWATRTSSDLLT